MSVSARACGCDVRVLTLVLGEERLAVVIDAHIVTVVRLDGVQRGVHAGVGLCERSSQRECQTARSRTDVEVALVAVVVQIVVRHQTVCGVTSEGCACEMYRRP